MKDMTYANRHNKRNPRFFNHPVDCHVWFSSFFSKKYCRCTKKMHAQSLVLLLTMWQNRGLILNKYVCQLLKALAWCWKLHRHETRWERKEDMDNRTEAAFTLIVIYVLFLQKFTVILSFFIPSSFCLFFIVMIRLAPEAKLSVMLCWLYYVTNFFFL